MKRVASEDLFRDCRFEGGCERDSATSDLASQGTRPMLYTIAVLLIILWLLGFLSGAAMGGFIHILLVIAVIMILVNLISGSKRK